MNQNKEEKPMRTNKKITAVTIIMIVAILFGGCSSGDKYPEFLTKHSWMHFAICNETISFGEDGQFAYYCACGEPVDDSDLYEKYTYNEDTSTIQLKPKENNSIIKVLRYEKSRLLLDFTGTVKEFIDSNDPLLSEATPEIGYDNDNVTAGFSSYLSIIDKDGRNIVSAPAGYDGNDPEYKEYLLSERLVEDARFYEWNLSVTEGSSGIDTESSFRKLTEKQAEEIIASEAATGFVWYNEDVEIEKIVFFGNIVENE